MGMATKIAVDSRGVIAVVLTLDRRIARDIADIESEYKMDKPSHDMTDLVILQHFFRNASTCLV